MQLVYQLREIVSRNESLLYRDTLPKVPTRNKILVINRNRFAIPNGFVRQKLLLTTTDFYLLCFGANIT